MGAQMDVDMGSGDLRQRKGKNVWAYSIRTHESILASYDGSIEPEWPLLSPLFEFYVLHSPAEGQSALGIKIEEYGWSPDAWRDDLQKRLDSILTSEKRRMLALPSRQSKAGLARLFADYDLGDGPLANLHVERAVVRPECDSYCYLRLFRHVRNCLAHGRFVVVEGEGVSGPIMIMEDKDKYSITARMVLRVETLYKWRNIILGGPDVEWQLK